MCKAKVDPYQWGGLSLRACKIPIPEAEQRSCGVCHGLYEGNHDKDYEYTSILDYGALQCSFNHEPLLPAGGTA